MDDERSDVEQDSGAFEDSVYVAAWWGKCNIPNQELDINLAAHIPHNVRWKLASILPGSLCLNQCSRNDVWPEYFTYYPPTQISIDFIFFSEGRDEIVLDNLLNDAICSNLALKAKIGEADLLIFTSLQLPEKLHRSKGKCYFWGIIMAQNPFFSQEELENDACIENNDLKPTLSSRLDDRRSHKGKVDPINISEERNLDQRKVGRMHVSDKKNPFTQAAKAKKKSCKLDDAWKYAYQLDQYKNKTQCRLCGFVSVSGGISRLKAHLAGGAHRFPGCPNVSPEIKQAMGIWFQKWMKKASATWVEKRQDLEYQSRDQGKALSINTSDEQNPDRGKVGPIDCSDVPKNTSDGQNPNQEKAGPIDCSDTPNPRTKNTRKKGREPDNSWEHTIPSDTMSTQCKYCDFVCTSGRIALKVHLDGGDPTIGLEGCSNMPAEVKIFMSEATSQKKVIAKETIQDTHGAQVHYATRAQLDDAWKYAKQLDDSRNKIECRYCGFVSKFGGISRMKVHLAGGSPESHLLPGCPNVSREVKEVMAVWFSDFVKNSKAYWLKEELDNTLKRKRKRNNTWGQAILLDKEYVTKSNYSGFVSNDGGISPLKVDIAGNDPCVLSKCCPNMPPEVKALMPEVIISEPASKKDGRNETADEKIQAEDSAEPSEESNDREMISEDQIQAEDNYELARNMKGRDETAEENSKGENISELASERNGREDIHEDSVHGTSKLAREINVGEKAAVENIQEIEESDEGQETPKERPHFLQFAEKVTNITSKETVGRIFEKKNAKLEKVQTELMMLESHLASLP